MTFEEYMNSYPRGERTKVYKQLSDALGISVAYLRSIHAGHKDFPVEYVLKLQDATKGAVKCWEVAPKIYPRKLFDESLKKNKKKSLK